MDRHQATLKEMQHHVGLSEVAAACGEATATATTMAIITTAVTMMGSAFSYPIRNNFGPS